MTIYVLSLLSCTTFFSADGAGKRECEWELFKGMYASESGCSEAGARAVGRPVFKDSITMPPSRSLPIEKVESYRCTANSVQP